MEGREVGFNALLAAEVSWSRALRTSFFVPLMTRAFDYRRTS